MSWGGSASNPKNNPSWQYVMRLFQRRDCVVFAFNLLYLNGEHLRGLPLVEGKAPLKRLLRRKRARVLYVDRIETEGQHLFQKVCEARRKSRCGKVSPHQIRLTGADL